jgi:hypothetical protein
VELNHKVTKGTKATKVLKGSVFVEDGRESVGMRAARASVRGV